MAIVAVCGFFAHKQEIRHSYPSHTPSITSLIWCARQTGYDDGELINLILKIADARADDCFLFEALCTWGGQVQCCSFFQEC